MFVSAQLTRTMWSIKGLSSLCLQFTKWMGIVLCRLLYFCHTRPITLSTWILTLDIFFILSLQTLQCINTECLQQHVLCLVCSTSSAPFPLVNARICRRACLTPTGSAMLKPRSANTGSNLDNYPQCSVRYLSITRPPHVFETKCYHTLWSNS